MTKDIKSTVLLPRTEFPMRAGLPKKEPEILAAWQDMDFFSKLRAHREGCEKFILHDGPPYANGNLHIGHALNKILKDIINRFQSGLGKDANYVPGWDCHGLPIEWKIEETYRKKGKDKDQVPIVEFRKECRDFASHWMNVQSEEFQRLGVMGNWDDPYSTMKYSSEAVIAREIGKFLMNGSLFRGSKPVMWSAVEKTALAEAEIEYFDRTSTTIYARFPVVRTGHAALEGATVVIWTTTPWTMPGNRATAYGEDIDYSIWVVKTVDENSLTRVGERLVLADALADTVAEACGITGLEREAAVPASAFADTVLHHPLHADGYDHEVPMLPADYVTTDQGTGIVHIAPGHGAEDYLLGIAHGVPVPETVGADGRIMEHLPIFAGMSALKDNEKIADLLAEHGGLTGRGTVTHSYPHSWRSHAPLMFRNTPQWFISMESHGLRDAALKSLAETAFYPPQGQTRLTSMIATRPDWCISRQRAWGVPIPVFVHKASGEPLRDQAVIDRIVAAFETEGADAWFASPPERFLGEDYDPAAYDQVQDIVDVWFDSGSTHAFLLEGNDDMAWPADMYLEGSDQHRGWFHSSLLESCGTRGRAPYDSVLTHGFVLDEQGRKMSKSLGNTVTPQDVIKQNGADILRIWVANSDYYDDLRIGPEILQRQVDHYRRLRNTFRYLLGSLDGYSDAEKVDFADMPELERWVLARLHAVDATIRKAIEGHDYHLVFTTLHHFCNNDLSAFYFDIRKDTLYCADPAGIERRACRTVMDQLFHCLVPWIAPILCFTAEEAWQTRYQDWSRSVHFETWPDLPDTWADEDLVTRWGHIRQARLVVNGAIEKMRAAGEVKSSLLAHPHLYAPDSVIRAFDGLDAADIFITSAVTLEAGDVPAGAFTLDDDQTIGAVIGLAEGGKCQRCWKVLPEVGSEDEALCGRCETVVSTMDAA
ncbi:MAG: isoleucine--tRNA ligase [Candidatus Puniceispirillales bacterium]